ncbi:hypothetical protein Tmari_0001 [Thermotoga maritima MSB8]|nr:hypothetical protein Tmari_0001 [Thermotoga maritima MSB8]
MCVRMVYGKEGYGRSKNILLSECVCGIISLELNGFQYFLRGMETL